MGLGSIRLLFCKLHGNRGIPFSIAETCFEDLPHAQEDHSGDKTEPPLVRGKRCCTKDRLEEPGFRYQDRPKDNPYIGIHEPGIRKCGVLECGIFREPQVQCDKDVHQREGYQRHGLADL